MYQCLPLSFAGLVDASVGGACWGCGGGVRGGRSRALSVLGWGSDTGGLDSETEGCSPSICIKDPASSVGVRGGRPRDNSTNSEELGSFKGDVLAVSFDSFAGLLTFGSLRMIWTVLWLGYEIGLVTCVKCVVTESLPPSVSLLDTRCSKSYRIVLRHPVSFASRVEK